MKNFIQYITEAKVNEERMDLIQKLLTKEGFKWERTTQRGGVIDVWSADDGARKKDTIKIKDIINKDICSADWYNDEKKYKWITVDGGINLHFHPMMKTGVGPGIINEETLEKNINILCKHNGAINIIFRGQNGVSYKCENVIGAKRVGDRVKEQDENGKAKKDSYLKADVFLKTGPDAGIRPGYNISIKQKNAGSWESSDARFKKDAEEKLTYAVDNKLTEIIPYENTSTYTLTNVVCWKLRRDQARQVVFGKDILGQGCIVQATFSDIEFTEDVKTGKEWYIIEVPFVFVTLADVMRDEEHQPWCVIRRGTGRAPFTIHGVKYKGLRVQCYYKKYVNSRTNKVIV